MKVYTYSQARQKLAKLLKEAQQEGQVQIKKRDGQVFEVRPVKENKSALDITGVETDVDLQEINNAVRESRERS